MAPSDGLLRATRLLHSFLSPTSLLRQRLIFRLVFRLRFQHRHYHPSLLSLSRDDSSSGSSSSLLSLCVSPVSARRLRPSRLPDHNHRPFSVSLVFPLFHSSPLRLQPSSPFSGSLASRPSLLALLSLPPSCYPYRRHSPLPSLPPFSPSFLSLSRSSLPPFSPSAFRPSSHDVSGRLIFPTTTIGPSLSVSSSRPFVLARCVCLQPSSPFSGSLTSRPSLLALLSLPPSCYPYRRHSPLPSRPPSSPSRVPVFLPSLPLSLSFPALPRPMHLCLVSEAVSVPLLLHDILRSSRRHSPCFQLRRFISLHS